MVPHWQAPTSTSKNWPAIEGRAVEGTRTAQDTKRFFSRLPSTARSMIVGRVFLVLTGACQFGHGVLNVDCYFSNYLGNVVMY